MARKSRLRVPRPNPSPSGRTGSRVNARDQATRTPGARRTGGGNATSSMTTGMMRGAIHGHRQEVEARRIEAEQLKELQRRESEERQWAAEDAAADAEQMKQKPGVGPGVTQQIQPGRPTDTSARPMTASIPVVARVPQVQTPAARNPAAVAPRRAAAPKPKPTQQPITKPAVKRPVSVPRPRQQRR